MFEKGYDANGNHTLTEEGRQFIKNGLTKANINVNPADCRIVDIGGLNTHYVIQWEPESEIWQLDPETTETRHKGIGSGCFWTDWE